MNRKTKSENDTGVSPEAAAPRQRRQTAASRARRASPPAATSVPFAEDGEAAVMTPEPTTEAAVLKSRRRPQAPRTTRTQVKAKTSAAPPAAAEPSREAIAELAYLYWQARGGQDGSADQDWLEAERELQQRISKSLL